MVTSIFERLSSVIVVIYGYRDSKQTNLTLPAVKTDLCCPCFTSSSSISSPHHHCASQITRETYPDSKSHPTNPGIIERCKKWRWLVKQSGSRLNEEKVDWKNEDFHNDHVNQFQYKTESSSNVEIDDGSRLKPQRQFVVVVDLDSNNNDTNDGKSDTPSGSMHDVEIKSKKPVNTSSVKLTFEGFGSNFDGQTLQKRSLNQHQNASLDEESICSSKDTCSALTGKKSASLYFHQICDELPPFSSEQVYYNNKTNANNVKNTNTKNSNKPENNSDNNISNKNNIDIKNKCWERRAGKNSELGENISASLESNLPGNQPNIGESTGGRRKQSLTVPEELKFHPHHSHHLLSSTSHQHHHHRHRVHRYGQHSRDASPEHSRTHQHCYRQYTPSPSHPRPHTQQHHQRTSSMGHQQLEHRSDEGTIEETASPKCKPESSRSPSPLSTPSPSGSTSLQFFSRPFDDQSIGSSCSSSGVELEFTRKCTVSADSLLLHPDITGSSSDTGVTSVNLGGAMGGGSRMGHQYHHSSHPSYHHLSETVSGSTGTCLGRDEAKPMSSDSSLEAGKGYKAGLLLDPGSLVKRKISGSLSSDQIHDDLMFSDKVTLTPGTRSVSPKMIFTGKFRRDKNTSTSSPSSSRVTSKQTTNPTEPLTGSPSTAGVSIPVTSQPSTSQSPSTSEKRKASMANVVLSGPGRLARLLRRTHSAGCSKDVPSHALFLREKPMKHHATSAPTEGEMGDKRRGRKQAPALEDMKQRLRFLRRRHTDSSIQSTNVRPSPEEAQKWSESFHLLMRNKYGATLFKAFLAREYSQENIEFWIACEEFKKVRPAKMPSKARKIYDDFVAVKSPKEINLDPNLRTNIFQSLTSPEEGTFDIAQRKIQGMLEQDAYLRFLQSELYRDLLVPSEPKKADATCKYESGKLSPESHL